MLIGTRNASLLEEARFKRRISHVPNLIPILTTKIIKYGIPSLLSDSLLSNVADNTW